MYFKQFLFTVFFVFSLTPWVGVFAKTGEVEKQDIGVKTDSWSHSSILDREDKDPLDEKEEKWGKEEGLSQSGISTEGDRTGEKKLEIRLKKDINAYIIESYKAQWNKIIKDLSIKLGKAIPDPEERITAYEKIQESLKIRLDKTEEMVLGPSKKEILQEFLNHLIQLLDKKIDELKK